MSSRTCVILFCCCMALHLMILPIHAQIVLKPNGQNAAPLRVKVISANVTVEGAVATTRQTLIFQNETAERIEADFLYTLPLNTVVTYFAYWYGQEKVVAQIMEKERAAAIYAHITSRMRDPALIEMVGKNTFRARIFPVMENADLKVEMHLATVVPADTHHLAYVYPFPAQSKRASSTRKASIEKPKSREKLDSMDVRVVFKQSANLLDIKTNYGDLERKEENGFVRFRLHGKRYLPPKDLQVTARRTPQPLQADLTSSWASGQNGFFTLVLTTDKPLTKPKVQIAGVSTSEVFTQGDKTNARIFRLFGRYRGSGKATVTLRGVSNGQPVSYTAPLVFEAKIVRNNATSKLWASTKIEKLSAGRGTRNAIITVSKRYNLPSKYTSWLAVPQEEMRRYENERIEAEIEVVATDLARLIARKKGDTPAAKKLRAELEQLCQKSQYGSTPDYALFSALQDIAVTLNTQILEKRNEWQQEFVLRSGHTKKAKKIQGELDRLNGQADRLYNAQEKFYQKYGSPSSYRAGDPLISVDAPADLQQVIALLPGGEIKRLAYNAVRQKWEARFDIPTYAAEGSYTITVILIRSDGTRQTLTMTYRVDMTPPKGNGTAKAVTTPEPTVRLELNASTDTARVTAILPWKESVQMNPSTHKPNAFFALVKLPKGYGSRPSVVTYILTDQAHNRTTITVDLEQ